MGDILAVGVIAAAFGYFIGCSYYSHRLALTRAKAEHYEFMAQLYGAPGGPKTPAVEASRDMRTRATVNEWIQ